MFVRQEQVLGAHSLNPGAIQVCLLTGEYGKVLEPMIGYALHGEKLEHLLLGGDGHRCNSLIYLLELRKPGSDPSREHRHG